LDRGKDNSLNDETGNVEGVHQAGRRKRELEKETQASSPLFTSRQKHSGNRGRRDSQIWGAAHAKSDGKKEDLPTMSLLEKSE